MSIFGTIFNLGKAKMGEMEDKIEDKNRLSFAKQDIDTAEEDMRKSRVGLAQTKAAMMGLERKLKAKKDEVQDRLDKVSKLKVAEKIDLAKQQWEIKCELDKEVATLETSYEQYKTIYSKPESNVKTLGSNLSNMKRALDRMKTMEEVKNSNNAIAEINTDASQSAVSKFKERELRQQAELDASTALADGSKDSTGDIDAETEKALGGGITDSAGFDAA